MTNYCKLVDAAFYTRGINKTDWCGHALRF